jgi:hypothetical protein
MRLPLSGYSLPVLYETPEGGVVNEHMHTRAAGCASMFDVSHMGQIRWYGKDRVKFIESLVVGDIAVGSNLPEKSFLGSLFDISFKFERVLSEVEARESAIRWLKPVRSSP